MNQITSNACHSSKSTIPATDLVRNNQIASDLGWEKDLKKKKKKSIESKSNRLTHE